MAGKSVVLKGTVPAQYRDVFDLIAYENSVPRHLCLAVLRTTKLNKSTIHAIYESADTRSQGYLNRDGFYKLLAFTAVAQAGKPISDKSLDVYRETELPTPTLCSTGELKRLSRQGNPSEFNFTYSELMELDTLDLELLPGKKGLVFKHVEYTLTSKLHGSAVTRRYSDFETFHEILVQRYPYRLVPKMPPKKFVASTQFIEGRRRSLRQFVNLVGRHPVFYSDELVVFFLTFNGSDVQAKLKEKFRTPLDEFVRSPLASRARELVSPDVHISMEQSKAQLRDLHTSVFKLYSVMDKIISRAVASAEDLRLYGDELGRLGSNAALTMGGDGEWSKIRVQFRELPTVFASVSDRSSQLATENLQSSFETLGEFQSLLTAFEQLMERREKGVLREHQAAYAKMQTMKKHQGRMTSQKSVDEQDLQQQILQQESEVTSVERRNFFSLYCIQMETKLIYANLSMLPLAVERLASAYCTNHQELFAMWRGIVGQLSAISPVASPMTSDEKLLKSPSSPSIKP
eukprot:scpid61083/ scgid6281/ Sorting nexin-8